jgi:uncharacterized protein DUF397
MSEASARDMIWLSATSSPGTGPGGQVEVAQGPDGEVWLRDSADPVAANVRKFTKAEWAAFMDGVRNGEFDEL